MPELKGRTLEEIDELFANKVSAWKFKSYKTTIMDEAFRDVQKRETFGEKRDGKEAQATELVEHTERS